jgi:hypothetical protein
MVNPFLIIFYFFEYITINNKINYWGDDMLGFITGSLVGLLFLLIDSSVLEGLNMFEIIFSIIWITIIYGCFGMIVDYILRIIDKFKRR